MAKILIIDDDVALLASMGAALEEVGYGVTPISELDHARQLYAQQQPDLVILEVRSERDRGWELLAEFAPDTPVIVVSGASLEEDVVRGLEAGASDYLAKPYRTRELMARVRAALGAPVAAPLVDVPSLAVVPPHSPTPPADPLPSVVAATAAPEAEQPEASAQPEAAPAPPPVVRGERVLPEAPAWVNTSKPLAAAEPRRKRPRPDEETVFISEAEELALLREPVAASPRPVDAPRAAIDEPPRTIGQRLRNERLRRQLTLVHIENEIRVRISYLQAMEDDKFTLIPRGPASQQMLKAYADYLGIDTPSMVEEFRKLHYVDAAEPLPALGGIALARPFPRWIILLVAVLLAVGLVLGAIFSFDPLFFVNVGQRANQLWLWLQSLLPG